MNDAQKNAPPIEAFLAAEPGSGEWAGAIEPIVKGFARLDPEDQTRVAEGLARNASAGPAADIVDRLYGLAGTSLPALTVLARARVDAGREADPDLPGRIENWLTICEDTDAVCDALDYFSLPDPARAAVRDHLALWMRADVLAALKDEAPDKAQAKELAKALHRAKSAGASLPGANAAAFVMPERDEYADEAYLSPPDALGYSFIYLYRTVLGKNSLFVLMLNDRDGVLRFDHYQVTRPRFERILASTRKNPHAVIVKTDPAFARRMVRKAEESGVRRGVRQNSEYLGKRRALGIAGEPEAEHSAWTRLDRDEIAGTSGLAHRSAELARHRIFADWQLNALEEGKLMSALAELDHSLLHLSPAQKRERMNAALEREAVRAVEDTGREAWRDRLLDCAYLLALIGDEDEAKMAAATALALERPSEPLPPFFIELLGRSVARDQNDEPPAGPDPDRGGLIIT